MKHTGTFLYYTDVLSQNTVTTTTAPIIQTTDPPSTEQATTDTSTPSETCGGSGWRRVAFINMTDPNQDCPQGFNLSDYSVRSCSRVENGFNDCSNSVTFSVDSEYSQVCGRATAYQFGQHSAFFGYNVGVRDIDEAYVDGLSLTHGSPRTHIWTFASGLYNGTNGDMHISVRCPCDLDIAFDSAPPYVGDDYFCDSVATVDNWNDNQYRLFSDNALWDGQENLNECFGLNNPPWFYKTLPEPTTDDIELRMCFTLFNTFSDIAISLFEVYVH